MDKTININIAGTLFKIDDEAFRILRDYLQAINNRFRNVQGGNETIEDIESRISEIFQSQKGLAGVINRENVEAMISIIGKPGDFDVNDEGTDQPLSSSPKKRMYRNPDDKIIAGVCSGLGAYLDTDPVLFRILFTISALFFGAGFLLYLVLWVALPEANTDGKKREMYGSAYHAASSLNRQADGKYYDGYTGTSKIGNAFNEVFRAIGRVFYITFRIFMIIIGLIFVLMGFLAIISLLMIFVFKMPWAFSSGSLDSSLVYFPDFLNYIVNPSVSPWIIGLSLTVLILPMLAFIYWGVKMIFWFRAKDGIVSLIAFVLWIMSITALSIIIFNEGISFAESARTSAQTIFPNPPDTLYVISDNKVEDLKFNTRFALPDNDYTVFLVDSTEKIYISPTLKLNISDDKTAKIEIQKRSSGSTGFEASRKAESLLYNYRIKNDTLYLDEYFTLSEGSKWTADQVTIKLFLPEKTILYFDTSAEQLFHRRIQVTRTVNDEVNTIVDYDTEPWELGNRFWAITEEGLRESNKEGSKQK
jgi:phage shock protein PspC (stress-responsive transcriptional regulator)